MSTKPEVPPCKHGMSFDVSQGYNPCKQCNDERIEARSKPSPDWISKAAREAAEEIQVRRWKMQSMLTSDFNELKETTAIITAAIERNAKP
jgi:hypothetical protein